MERYLKFDEISSQEDLLNYWEQVFTMWKKTPQMYSKYLSYVGEEFKTTFEDYAPLHMVGEYNNTVNKILLVSSHPSVHMKQNYIKFEHEQRKLRAIPTERSKVKWASQNKFAQNYFTLLREHNQSILFFTNLEKLIRYYDQLGDEDTLKYDVLQKRIVQVDILPFYSHKITLKELNSVLDGALKRIKKFYFENEFDTMVINGKMLYDDLLKVGFIKPEKTESKPLTVQGKQVTIKHYSIEYNGMRKKGIAVPFINNLRDGQKKKVANEIKKTTEWNKENSWEVLPGQ